MLLSTPLSFKLIKPVCGSNKTTRSSKINEGKMGWARREGCANKQALRRILGSWRDAIGARVINVVDFAFTGSFFASAVCRSELDRWSSIKNRLIVKLMGRIWLSRMKLRIFGASKRRVLANLKLVSHTEYHAHDKPTFLSHPDVPIPRPENRELRDRRVALALHQLARKVLEQCRLQHPVFEA
jgi:hypothetical protein